MKINPLTATAIGLAVGSIATVMLSGKKISGKKVTRELRSMACGLTDALPMAGRMK